MLCLQKGKHIHKKKHESPPGVDASFRSADLKILMQGKPQYTVHTYVGSIHTVSVHYGLIKYVFKPKL